MGIDTYSIPFGPATSAARGSHVDEYDETLTAPLRSVVEYRYLSAIFSSIRLVLLSSCPSYRTTSSETATNSSTVAGFFAIAKSWLQLAAELVQLEKQKRCFQLTSSFPLFAHAENALEKGEEAHTIAKQLFERLCFNSTDAVLSHCDSSSSDNEGKQVQWTAADKCATPKRTDTNAEIFAKTPRRKKKTTDEELTVLAIDVLIQKLSTFEIMAKKQEFEVQMKELKKKVGLKSLSIRASSAIQFAMAMSK